MTNTIAQLWNGNLEPICYSGKNNREINESLRALNKALEKLEEKLKGNDLALFENYSKSANEMMMLLSEQAFCDGYCMGTKLTVEALTGAEQLL